MNIPSGSSGLLGSKERTLLRALYGQDIYLLFSPWINASFSHFECGALSFALRRGTGFLILNTVWEEDANLADFGWMTVGMAERAKDVPYSDEGNPFCASTISLTPSSPISGISVFRKRVTPNWEFDCALLIEHEERFRYVISYEPSAFQRLIVSFTEETISKALADLQGEPV